MKRTMLTAVACLLATGCLVPLVAPGSRVETGPVTNVGGEANANGVQVKVGSHLASVAMSTAQRHDVGAGYIAEVYTKPTAIDESDFARRRSLHGGYLEYGRRIDSNPHSRRRIYLGVRGEVLAAIGAATNVGVGASARVTYEFAKAGEADFTNESNCGASTGTTFGTTAVGLYAEAGYRALEGNAAVFTAGVTLRLPSLVGIAIVIPVPGC